MDQILWIFRNFVYNPLLNILELLFHWTGDIGVSILILSLIINLLLWPLFAKSYINSQKTRFLQPKLKEIQEKYKDDKQKMLHETMAFNRKHGIRNSSIFLVLFAQLFFISGLWYLINDVSNSREIIGLYPFLFDDTKASFDTLAFGFLEIGTPARDFIILPILNGIFTFAQGYYTFRIAPQPKIAPKPKEKEKEKSAFDPETFQKSLEFQSIYVFPALIFFVNLGFPVGLSLYSVILSLVSLIRQVFLTMYYSKHTDKLMEEIVESDPTAKDDNPDNNLENTANPANLTDDPQPTKVIEKDQVDKKKTTKKGKKTKKKKSSK
jgi:YidC/Oxa1 family membrane protein insertase